MFWQRTTFMVFANNLMFVEAWWAVSYWHGYPYEYIQYVTGDEIIVRFFLTIFNELQVSINLFLWNDLEKMLIRNHSYAHLYFLQSVSRGRCNQGLFTGLRRNVTHYFCVTATPTSNRGQKYLISKRVHLRFATLKKTKIIYQVISLISISNAFKFLKPPRRKVDTSTDR